MINKRPATELAMTSSRSAQLKNKPLIKAIFYNNPDQYPPIINSTRLLAQAGYRLEILCREYNRRWNVTYPKQAQLYRFDNRAGSSWHEYFAFVRQVLRRPNHQADLFVGHDMHGFLPARLLASYYHRPLVYHCHDFSEGNRKLPLGSHLVRLFERRFAQTADLVIVPDHARSLVMVKELRLAKNPLIVANAPMYPAKDNGTALAQSLKERGKQYNQILFRQGRIGEGHALENTLRSIPFWASRNWGLVVMGPGEPNYIESLKQLAYQLGVVDQFVVLPPIGYDGVSSFTSGATLGHALYEPIHINNVHITTASNKIMEYMAAGLPLLVSNSPGLRSLIDKYQCGLTADESSPESIAVAVNTLFGDQSKAQQMGYAAMAAFEQVFNYRSQYEPALAAIERLIFTRSKSQ